MIDLLPFVLKSWDRHTSTDTRTQTHTTLAISQVSPLLQRTAKSYTCIGTLTSLPLTLQALADTLTPTCTVCTHHLIGLWPASRDQATHRAQGYILCVRTCVCICVHVMNVLNVHMKGTGKVNEGLSREITLSPKCLYISLWAVKQEAKTETITMCWVSNISHCSQYYHSNGIQLPR